jgi:hypothetical protein
MPIGKFPGNKFFQNPYEIERVLEVIFVNYYNVSIELIMDACREQNLFKEKFEAAKKQIPTVKVDETKFDLLCGKIMTAEGKEDRRDTGHPWPGKPEVNNIFIRNYSCEYGESTDAEY